MVIQDNKNNPADPKHNQNEVIGDFEVEDINSSEGVHEEKFSSVAADPQYKKLVFVLLAAGFLAVVWFLFFGRTPSKDEAEEQQKQQLTAEKEQVIQSSTPVTDLKEQQVVVEPPKIAEPPPIKDPTPPDPPPPPVPAAPSIPTTAPNVTGVSTDVPSNIIQNAVNTTNKDDERLKKLEEKRKAGIIVVGGGGSKADSEFKDGKDSKDSKDSKEKEGEKKKDNSDFLGFGEGSLDGVSIEKTQSQQVKATKLGNLNYVVAEGKVINAVLETAIDTDLTGILRAIVARDVYSEAGNNILIPKGSRLIGTYENDIKDGQTRVNVIWGRLIRPDGIDVKLDSVGTDQLGRAGVVGKLNTKFWTRMGIAAMVSFIIPTVANAVTGAKKTDSVSTTTTTGGTSGTGSTTTTNTSLGAMQAKQAADEFGKIATEALQNAFPTKPTISVPQGTKVNVLVKKDILFPSNLGSNSLQVNR